MNQMWLHIIKTIQMNNVILWQEQWNNIKDQRIHQKMKQNNLPFQVLNYLNY